MLSSRNSLDDCGGYGGLTRPDGFRRLAKTRRCRQDRVAVDVDFARVRSDCRMRTARSEHRTTTKMDVALGRAVARDSETRDGRLTNEVSRALTARDDEREAETRERSGDVERDAFPADGCFEIGLGVCSGVPDADACRRGDDAVVNDLFAFATFPAGGGEVVVLADEGFGHVSLFLLIAPWGGCLKNNSRTFGIIVSANERRVP